MDGRRIRSRPAGIWRPVWESWGRRRRACGRCCCPSSGGGPGRRSAAGSENISCGAGTGGRRRTGMRRPWLRGGRKISGGLSGRNTGEYIPHMQLCVCLDRLGKREKAYGHHLLAKSLRPEAAEVRVQRGVFSEGSGKPGRGVTQRSTGRLSCALGTNTTCFLFI